jgi:hypothetical protein
VCGGGLGGPRTTQTSATHEKMLVALRCAVAIHEKTLAVLWRAVAIHEKEGCQHNRKSNVKIT